MPRKYKLSKKVRIRNGEYVRAFYARERRRNSPKHRLMLAHIHARQRGIKFHLSLKDMELPAFCAADGKRFKPRKGNLLIRASTAWTMRSPTRAYSYQIRSDCADAPDSSYSGDPTLGG